MVKRCVATGERETGGKRRGQVRNIRLWIAVELSIGMIRAVGRPARFSAQSMVNPITTTAATIKEEARDVQASTRSFDMTDLLIFFRRQASSRANTRFSASIPSAPKA
jgi:hypothetical protein